MSDSESETDDSAGDFGIVRACDGDGGKVSAGRDETVEGVRWPFHQLAMEADGAQPHSSESSGPGELEERASPRSSRHPGSPSCNGSPVYRNGEGHWDDGDQGDSGISDCETESFSETPPLSDASEPSADETGYEQSAVQVLLDSR